MEHKNYKTPVELTTVKLLTEPAGKSPTIIHGFLLGKYKDLYNLSWKDSGSIETTLYSVRQRYTNLPYDDKVFVLLAFKGMTKVLVHESEIEVTNTPSPQLGIADQLLVMSKRITRCSRCFKPGDIQYIGSQFRVYCKYSCHVFTNYYNTPEEAITEWNTQNL